MSSYVQQTWEDGRAGGTPLSSARLSHMEMGIEASLRSDEAIPTGSAAGIALDSTYAPRTLLPVLLDASYSNNTKFAALLTTLASTGGAAEIPAGTTITLSTGFTIPGPVIIKGEGTIHDSRTSPATPLFTLGPAASGSKIKCNITGSISATYVVNHNAVTIQGTDNGINTPPTYVTDIDMAGASITGFGMHAIYGEFVQDSNLNLALADDLGYAGVIVLSAKNVTARLGFVRALGPGSAGDSYAAHFSRRSNKTDLVRYPPSTNFVCWADEVHGVPGWDGVGCHAGQTGLVGFGTMYNVRKPVDVVGATGDDAQVWYAPNNIVIDVGSADSGVRDGSLGPAVTVSGAFKTSSDVVGNPTEYAKGIIIKGGALKGYGDQSSTLSGAYYLLATKGLKADFGSASEPSPYMVTFYHDNLDVEVTGAVALDPWTNTASIAGVIQFNDDYNTGTINGCRGTQGAKSANTSWAVTTAYTYGQYVTKGGYVYKVRVAGTSGATGPVGTVAGAVETDGTVTWVNITTVPTHVNTRGLYVNTTVTHNRAKLGSANDFSASATPIFGLSKCVWGTFGTDGVQTAGSDINTQLSVYGLLPATVSPSFGTGLLAARPSATSDTANSWYFATDVNTGTLYRCVQTGAGPPATFGWTAVAVGSGSVQSLYKTADTTRPGSASRLADPHLTAIPVVVGVYIFDSWVAYSSSTTADLAIQPSFGGSGAGNIYWAANGLATNASATTSATGRQKSTTNTQDNVGGVGVGTAVECRPSGTVVVSTPGTFGFLWGQQTSDPTDTVLYTGSWLRLTKIA